MILAPLTLK